MEAADLIGRNPVTIQLRYLQTLREIGNSENSTIVFPFPLDLIGSMMNAVGGDATTGTAAPAVPELAATRPAAAVAENGPVPSTTHD